MSNQSQILNISSTLLISESEIPSLDQLLDSLGFDPWKIITATFVIPTISLVGVFLCSLSVWIFFQEKFKDPVFFYYRLLCIVYIIHLVHNIPFGFLYSPHYFPQINTYFTAVFLIYHLYITSLLFHFVETIQMAILLTRMKIYNSFVNKNFSSKPWVISLAFFLTCLLLSSVDSFAVYVNSIGTYVYYDDHTNSSKKIGTLFYFTSSKFSQTLHGQILLAVTVPFLNLVLCVIIGITLNVVSVSLYRSYVRERRRKEEAYTRVGFNRNQAAADGEDVIQVVVPSSKKLTKKEIDENRAESNMLKMALTLSFVSTSSRILIILSYIYFFFFNAFSSTLTSLIISNFVYILGPTLALFVFYSFNKMFREEFRKKLKKNKKNPNQRD